RIFQSVETEILAGHGGFAGEHIFFSEPTFESSSDAARQFRIVDGGRHIVFGDFDDGGAIGGNAGGSGDSIGDSGDGSKNFFALGGSHGSNGELQMGLIGNDVVFGAGVEKADSDNSGNLRVHFTADDSLQGHNDFRSDEDRIFGS